MAREFPRAIQWLLRMRFGRTADLFILGDLMEEYAGGKHSQRWLWRQALSTLWPSAAKASGNQSSQENRMISALCSSIASDLRYAIRALRANPGFTAVAVLAIGLGIGVNTGIFTVLNGAVLRPLPVHAASEVVSIYQNILGKFTRNVSGSDSFFSTAEYRTYRDGNHVFSGVLAYAPFLTLTLGGDHPQEIYAQLASCNYFEVLNVRPALGRTFSSSDCSAPGANAYVVLGHDLWRSAFAEDPAIAGKKIVLNRQLFTIIGVAPAGFHGTEAVPSALWAPLTMQHSLETRYDAYTGNWSWLILLGRMKPSVSLKQVRADLSLIASHVDQLTPGRKTMLTVNRATLLGIPEARQIVLGVSAILLAAVGMVLLIACANVANLLLARATARRNEIAIRLSIGATRGRLIRQLLTESMLIALAGGALGSLLAIWCFDGITAWISSHLPPGVPPLVMNFHPDFRVFAYALAITVATGGVFGLVPAIAASRPNVNAALKGEGIGFGTRSGRGFLRQSLVGLQVAVSMILLIAAGLMLHALHYTQTLDPGFEMKNIATVALDLRRQGYDEQRAVLFNRELRARLGALPSVDGVAQAITTPLSDNHHGTAILLPGDKREYSVEFNNVSSQYFTMVGIPIVRGRDFSETEINTGAHVAIVTESTARHFWNGQDAVGRIFRFYDGPETEVIGVAKDAQVSRIAETNTIYMYLPEGPTEQLRSNLLIHSESGYATTAKGIAAVIHAMDPDLVVDIARLEDNMETWRMPSRIGASLAGALGVLGLALASIGVYGVVSYYMSRRVREIGLRMTLGADAGDVLRMMLGQAMRPVLAGAFLGVAGCAAVSTVLRRMLFGISAHDPVAFIAVPLLLVAVAFGASYIPARRATKVDPMVALRYE